MSGCLIKKNRLLRTIEVLCPSGSKEEAATFLDDLIIALPRFQVLGTRILFWLFWWMPIFVIFRVKTLGSLNDVQLSRYLAWWEDHRWSFIREIFNTIKSISLIARLSQEWEPS